MSSFTPENIKLEGFAELAKAMQQLAPNIGRNVLRGAVNAGATVIKKEAVRLAPLYTGDDPRASPGLLKRAIYQKQIRELSDLARQTYFVGVRSGKNFKSVKKGKKIVNLDAFYGRFVEFGTSKMAATPFLRPALENQKEAAIAAMKAYLEKRIPAEVAKR